ncbi:MAG: hypothetical protein D4S01_05410 [Dehalococcoidia bacterium]|nr:MAG: hypothetical protein D4S01_05410 [Dehalococcoidia bacterium]
MDKEELAMKKYLFEGGPKPPSLNIIKFKVGQFVKKQNAVKIYEINKVTEDGRYFQVKGKDRWFFGGYDWKVLTEKERKTKYKRK